MKALEWHTTQLGDRVFTHHVRGSALHSGTVLNATRKRVRVLFDDNRLEAWRKYSECFPAGEVFMQIRTANARASVEFVQVLEFHIRKPSLQTSAISPGNAAREDIRRKMEVEARDAAD